MHYVNGEWRGDSTTLYHFTDQHTGRVFVRPPMAGIGPACDVRVATRVEAETLWQCPLHTGWRVAETPGRGEGRFA